MASSAIVVSLATDADDGVVPSVAGCAVLNVVGTSSLLVVDNVVSTDDDAVDVCSLLPLVVVSVLSVDTVVVDPSSVVDELLVVDEDVVVSDDDSVALVTVVVSMLVNGGAVMLLP